MNQVPKKLKKIKIKIDNQSWQFKPIFFNSSKFKILKRKQIQLVLNIPNPYLFFHVLKYKKYILEA
jgi:hypothetical protein